MKALTLWPEWAFGVCYLGKRVENRSWRPAPWLIGQRIAIHAGAHIGGRPGRPAMWEGLAALRNAASRARWPLQYRETVWAHLSTRPGPMVVWSSGKHRITRGAIVCTARLESVRWDSPSPWAVPGQVHWCLANVEVLAEPVPCRGRQGLWEVPAELVEQMQEATP